MPRSYLSRLFSPWLALLILLTTPLAGTSAPVWFEIFVLSALLWTLGWTGWRLASRLLPGESGATRATLAVLLATAHATVPATVLGHFGQLWPVPFFLVVASLAALVALVTHDEHGERPATTVEPTVALPEAGEENRWARPLAAAAVVALCASALVSIHSERYAPSGKYGFDDNSYHLATVATWVERGDLAGVKFGHGDRSTPYYPIVGELVSWVLLAPFGDNDALARWSQLPYFLASLVAIAALGRRLGLPPRWTTLAILLYAGLKRAFPVLALGAGNDHAVTFFALAGLDAALVAAGSSMGAGVYLGLACGLMVGTKFLGLLYAPLLLATGAVALALRGPAAVRASLGKLGSAAAVAILVTFLAGGYTYVRNAVTAGNPLYPVPIELGRWELPGTSGVTLAERRHLPPFAIDLPEFLFVRDLFGSLGRFLWVPAALLAPTLALIFAARRRQERSRWLAEAAVLVLPGAFFLVFLFQIHDHRDSRYLFPALALAALGAARLLEMAYSNERTRRWGSALEIACFAGTLLMVLGRHRDSPETLALMVALALCAAVLARGERPLVPAFVRSPAFAAGLFLALLPGLVHAVGSYPERKLRQVSAAARALEHEVGRRGAGVAYVGYNYPYPFWGSRLQNRVVIVPRNFQRDARLYQWGGTANDFSYHPGKFEAWWRNLRALDVRYVVVVRAGEENPERAWMKAREERFERIAVDGDTEIWRVLVPADQSPSRYAKMSGATIEASD